eukprot:190837_1
MHVTMNRWILIQFHVLSTLCNTLQFSNWTVSSIQSPRTLSYSQTAVNEQHRAFYVLGDSSLNQQLIRYNIADNSSISSLYDFGTHYFTNPPLFMDAKQFYTMHTSTVYYVSVHKLYQIDLSLANPRASFHSDLPFHVYLTILDPCSTFYSSDHDYLFVVGGSFYSTQLTNTHILDITNDTWLSNTPGDLNTARRNHVCVIVDQYVYAIGGQTSGYTIEVLDIHDMDNIQDYSWRVMDGNFLRPRSGDHSANVMYGRSILVIGGLDAVEVEVIDTITEQVYIGGYMSMFVTDHCTAYYYPYLRVIGGTVTTMDGGYPGYPYASKDIYELYLSDPEINLTDYPVNIFPTGTERVNKTISIRSSRSFTIDQMYKYHAKFNVMDNICYDPRITMYYYSSGAFYNSHVVEVYDYTTSALIQECPTSRCDINPIDCVQEKVIANMVPNGSQVHIYVAFTAKATIPKPCEYTLWADITLRCDPPPTPEPTGMPTTAMPTLNPSKPTASPTHNPTAPPTLSPSQSTMSPSYPTNVPTLYPTTSEPTFNPTYVPTWNPTNHPTIGPTVETNAPSSHPTTGNPTRYPTFSPTPSPTHKPPFC